MVHHMLLSSLLGSPLFLCWSASHELLWCLNPAGLSDALAESTPVGNLNCSRFFQPSVPRASAAAVRMFWQLQPIPGAQLIHQYITSASINVHSLCACFRCSAAMLWPDFTSQGSTCKTSQCCSDWLKAAQTIVLARLQPGCSRMACHPDAAAAATDRCLTAWYGTECPIDSDLGHW